MNTNLGLNLQSSIEARPGFDYSLSANVVNTGFLPAQGTVVLNYDSVFTYLSHTPPSGTVNTINHTITWTTDSIRTGDMAGFRGEFNVPVPTPLGTTLTSSATITALPGFTEGDLTNNNDTHLSTVIGSCDPNDKHVYPPGAGANGGILHETRLFYRIRFQNTGTASAINVIVTDTIDDDLDMGTLLMVNASHNYVMVTNGRVVTWKFFNINLPDSNTNEPLSHGFIEYEINPVQGLPDGTTIENAANIYFDFNPPVITNATLNTLQTVIVSAEDASSRPSFSLYPVPARDRVFIVLEPGTGKTTIGLFDIAGKKIATWYEGEPASGTALEFSPAGLAPGVYLVGVEQGGVAVFEKMVRY